jgi:hypothetical protein
MEEMANANKILTRKVERKLPLGRRSRRWEDNVKVGDKQMGLGDVGWIELAQDMVQWQAELRNELSNSIRGEDSLAT